MSKRRFLNAVLGTVFSAALLSAATAGLLAPAGAHAQGKSASGPVVLLSTSAGDIQIQLDADKAPKTVANFVEYVKAGHYTNTVFHRVIENFMIQGGGFSADMKEKPTKKPIPLESKNGLKNERGTIAMARTSDPNSATAQFFINVKDNAFLDQANARDGNGYAVFGKVVSGMDVVDKIKAVPTGTKGPHQNVPVEPVVIKSAKIVK